MKGGGAKPRLKRLSLGHCGRLFVSGQRYKHIFEDFKRRNVSGFSSGTNRKCHPVLTFSLALRKSKQKESKTGKLLKLITCHPEFISGSCHRDLGTITKSQYLISKSELLTDNQSRHNKDIKCTIDKSKPVKCNKILKQVLDYCSTRTSRSFRSADILFCSRYFEFRTPSSLYTKSAVQDDKLYKLREIAKVVFGSNVKSLVVSRPAKRNVRGATRKAAFTLAEVLITLGIIGVVAAMTLPTLIQNYQDKATVSRLKKVYSELSQAYMMAYKDNEDPTNWGMSIAEKDDQGNIINSDGTKNMGDLFSKYLNVTKNCGLDEGCWYKGNVYSLNGKIYDSGSVEERNDLYKIALADGTLIAFGGLSSDCSVIRGNSKQLSNVCSWVIVDINGANRPNTYGIDLFEFLVSKYGIVPYGTPDDIYFPFETACRRNSTGVTAGNGCTAWVLYNENLDYTHCNDLSWNGKHKCK